MYVMAELAKTIQRINITELTQEEAQTIAGGANPWTDKDSD